MRFHLLCISLVGLAMPALAQQRVLPAALTNSPGASSTAYPYGAATAVRLQTIFEAAETGLSGPVTIKAIEVRTEETVTLAAKTSIDLQIEMSTTAITTATQTTTFSANRGANHVIVFNRKLVNIAATTGLNLGQYAGMHLLDTPFLYDPAGGSLLIEYDINSQPTGTYTHDVPFGATGRHIAIGTSCNGTTTTSTGGGLGATAVWSLTGGQANGVALHLLGVQLLTTPLPIPGNPGCSLYNTLDFLSVVPLTAAGAGSITFPIPSDPSLRGANVFGQFAAINATQNFDMTQSRQVTIGAVYGVGRVYNATSNTALTGTNQATVANVTRITY